MPDFNLEVKKDKQNASVLLEGNLTVLNMAAIHKELSKALKGIKNAEIQVTNVEDADITLVQLIIAYRKKFLAAKQEFTITFTLSGELNNLFARSGILNLL